MATKSKNFYYILVMTDSGPKFVTKLEHQGKMAYWDINEPPLSLSKYMAEEVAFGLSANFHQAYAIHSEWEIKYHPYNYKDFDIKWERKENKEKDGKI